MEARAMQLPTFQAFDRDMREQGFEEVIERKWQPSTVLDSHTHPFAVKAIVVQGEMWLKVGDEERHLVSGDEFSLEREVPHSERYGKEGATYWVARKYR
jgi:quercetin dioxygenase-like cupin family protein